MESRPMEDLPWNLWYPLFNRHELDSKPRHFVRFGLDWVGFRHADGTPFLGQNRCPHLGAALSMGTLENDELICPFHGFRYGKDGRCLRIPMLGESQPSPKGLQLQTIPLREVSGWIFGWWGDPTDRLPEIPLFETFKEDWRHGDLTDEWPVHLTRAIENQLDAAHLPFVHRRTIGRGLEPALTAFRVEAQPAGLRLWTGHRRRSSNEVPQEKTDPSIEFLYPGLWQLRIHERLRLIVGFVPIRADRTRFQVRACHRIRIPLLGSLFSRLLSLSNRVILNEDRRIVETLRPLSSLDAKDLLFGPDRAIVEFRRHWRSLIRRKDACD